jgi:hypothetical protein
MKRESTQNGRPEGDPHQESKQESDELGEQRTKRRKPTDSAPRLTLPDPPDPDNLPIDYSGPLEIEWP